MRLLCLTTIVLISVSAWRRFDPPRFPHKLVFIFWIMVCGLSLGYAVDPVYSFGEIKNEVGYSLLALIAFFVASSEKKWLILGSWAVLCSLTTIAIWALFSIFQMGYWVEAGKHGGSGTYVSLLLMALPLIFLLWNWQHKSRKLLVWISIIAAFAGAYSRQRVLWPVLGVEMGLLIYLLASRSGNHFSLKRAMGLFFGVLAVSSILLIATQGARLASQGGAVEIDNDQRLKYWPAVTSEILSHPLTGAGFGRNAMKIGYPNLVHAPEFWHAHNLVLNYGISMGIPGIIALLTLFSAMFLTYWKMYRHVDEDISIVGTAGLMLLSGVMLRNLSNDFFLRDMALLFWSLNGMLLGYGERICSRVVRKEV